MKLSTRVATAAACTSLIWAVVGVSSAQAGLLSILPGSCSNQPASQPFANWGDTSDYTPVPAGNFESGTSGWTLGGGAAVVTGNESYYVGGASDSHSLSLPGGSSATSPASCTNIYHPTARLFVQNTGASTSHLTVQALYPGLLGGVSTATLAQLSGTSSWSPSPAMGLLVSNLLSTLSLDQTAIAFRFAPADSTGKWRIDDVYLDPYGRG